MEKTLAIVSSTLPNYLNRPMPLPTYPELIPAILQWAADRDLLHPYGTAYLATPEGQHDKTCEEIEEASLELRKLAKTKALADMLVGINIPSLADAAVAILARRRNALALGFGDVLVTLCIQSSIQGLALEKCLFAAGRLSTSWGSDWHLGKPSDPPFTWYYVEHHASMLGVAIEQDIPADAAAYLGAVARCVEDTARIELSMLGPECLALALAKISGRQGEVVNGVFVKAGVSSR